MKKHMENNYNRRQFLQGLFGSASVLAVAVMFKGMKVMADETISKLTLSNEEWKKKLEPAAYNVLREEGTERPFTSPLNSEHKEGVFACAGCALPLFPSKFKYDSGTGWPSFFDVNKGAIETKDDNSFFGHRTEYHCAKCGGHQGHVFNDGPQPTGLRYCNNGVALQLIPAKG